MTVFDVKALLIAFLNNPAKMREEKDEENYYDNEEWDQVHKKYFLAYHQAKAHACWCASRPDEAEHLNRVKKLTFD